MEEKARENISRVLGLVALDLDVSTHCSISLAIISFTSSTATWVESHCNALFAHFCINICVGNVLSPHAVDRRRGKIDY